MIIVSPDNNAPPDVTDRTLAAESAAFLSRCSKELMSCSSKMKRTRLLKARSFPRILFANRITTGIFFAILATILFFAGGLLLSLFNVSLYVSLETPDRQISFRLPPQDSGSNEPAVVIPAAKPVDTTVIKKMQPDNQPLKINTIQSALDTGAPPHPVLPSPVPERSPVIKRILPPVVPKARMVLPPMPPADPAALPAPAPEAEPTSSLTPPPSPPVQQPVQPVQPAGNSPVN